VAKVWRRAWESNRCSALESCWVASSLLAEISCLVGANDSRLEDALLSGFIANRNVASIRRWRAGDWSEHALSGLRVASVVGARVSVIAEDGLVSDASSLWIANDLRAFVCLLWAGLRSVDAVSSVWIARVESANVSVVAGLVCADTTNLWIASDGEAVEERRVCLESWSVLEVCCTVDRSVDTTADGVASVCSATVSIITIDWRRDASECWIAGRGVAIVCYWASESNNGANSSVGIALSLSTRRVGDRALVSEDTSFVWITECIEAWVWRSAGDVLDDTVSSFQIANVVLALVSFGHSWVTELWSRNASTANSVLDDEVVG